MVSNGRQRRYERARARASVAPDDDGATPPRPEKSRMIDATILLGAVAYDVKVLALWEGMREHFRTQGVALDFALYSSYERLVEALIGGHVDVAYNDPLAHVRVKRRTEGRSVTLAMRDIDRDFTTKILVRRDAGIRALTDLHDRVFAVGSRDSAQARVLPLFFLKRAGVALDRLKLLPFEHDPGKHGDTSKSEIEVLAALHDGRAQAGAVGSLVWQSEQAAGRVDPHKLETLWTTPAYDHHALDALPSLPDQKAKDLTRVLFEMRWNNPKHRKLLEVEGHRLWVVGRDEGYAQLVAALDDLRGW
jgi:ABC-type phosphate/phosphonate transport system substrate-binding protein